ncbi:MAG: cysteine peptidase family C39 domain-containing protein [Planctomycetaceae bacterium]
MIRTLARYPLFGLFDAPQLEILESAGQEVCFSTGETIFQEGTLGAWVHVVMHGKARIFRRTPQGREKTLGMAQGGELLGDYVLLRPHNNSATCRAAESTLMFRIQLSLLDRQLAQLPGVRGNLKSYLRLHALIHYLRGQSFLGFMSAPSALTYLEHLQEERFRAGRTIQAPGLADDRWFFIESGSVQLQRAGECDELGAGDCFGERSLAGWSELPTAVALTDTRCLSLRRNLFEDPTQNLEQFLEQSLLVQRQKFRKLPWISQIDEADCGLAALAMVAAYFQQPLSLEDLHGRKTPAATGLSLRELKDLTQECGLKCDAVRVDEDHLEAVTTPAIAHFENGHYVVLYLVEEHHVVYGDPAAGIVRISQQEFKQAWSGNLLLIVPVPACPLFPGG